jgi:hypothetical protein
MTEQWFLDLDGVRSGPYQTPEVLSLIAEGEVLPHHRISKALKDSAWSTILDWRLEQAKHQTEREAREPRVQAAPPGPEVATFELPTIEEKTPEPPPPAPVPPPPPAPPPVRLEPTKPEPKLHLEPSSQTVSEETPAPVDSRSKRDPMAEMFDILQTNKQKREVRQQHQTPHEIDRPAPTRPEGGLSKIILIGAGLALIGFALGQLFQQAAPPEKPLAKEIKKASSPAPSPSASPTQQVLDRSTEKMTIKAVVQKKNEEPSAPAAKVSREASRAASRDAAPTPEPNDREIQELKDLKKELQELKAMKDQLRDNSAVEDFEDEGRYPAPNEISPMDSGPETIPAPNGVEPNTRRLRNPQASPFPPDTHY